MSAVSCTGGLGISPPQFVSRILLLLGLMWVGLLLLKALGEFRASPNIVTADVKLEGDSSMAMDPGYWSFAGSQVCLQHLRVDSSNLDRELERALRGNRVPDGPDASRWVQLAESCGARQNAREEGLVWAADGDRWRLRMVTTDANPPRLAVALVAIDQGPHWELTKVSPRPGPRRANLLPLPLDCTVTCTRQSKSGSPQMQLVSTLLTEQHLVSWWREQGWTVRPGQLAGRGSFCVRCESGGRAVDVWSADSAGFRTLMLTAVSGTCETTSNNLVENQR